MIKALEAEEYASSISTNSTKQGKMKYKHPSQPSKTGAQNNQDKLEPLK
jgi:hypothetical protein